MKIKKVLVKGEKRREKKKIISRALLCKLKKCGNVTELQVTSILVKYRERKKKARKLKNLGKQENKKSKLRAYATRGKN